jgi:hypothetical protein
MHPVSTEAKWKVWDATRGHPTGAFSLSNTNDEIQQHLSSRFSNVNIDVYAVYMQRFCQEY